LSEGFFNWTGNLNDNKRALQPPKGYKGPEPCIFYPQHSQHFSQSDFGILFPYLTQRFMKAEEPERVLKLNVRAVLQMLRNCDFEVAKTSNKDMEIEEDKDLDDIAILAKDSNVRGWMPVSLERRMSEAKLSTENEKKSMPADFDGPNETQTHLAEQAHAQTQAQAA